MDMNGPEKAPDTRNEGNSKHSLSKQHSSWIDTYPGQIRRNKQDSKGGQHRSDDLEQLGSERRFTSYPVQASHEKDHEKDQVVKDNEEGVPVEWIKSVNKKWLERPSQSKETIVDEGEEDAALAKGKPHWFSNLTQTAPLNPTKEEVSKLGQ